MTLPCCERCLAVPPPAAMFREVTICGLVNAHLCSECIDDLPESPEIDVPWGKWRRAMRHYDVYRAALVGPAANLSDCLRASDAMAEAEDGVRRAAREWLAVRPARANN